MIRSCALAPGPGLHPEKVVQQLADEAVMQEPAVAGSESVQRVTRWNAMHREVEASSLALYTHLGCQEIKDITHCVGRTATSSPIALHNPIDHAYVVARCS